MEPTPIRPLVEEAWSLVAIDEKAGHVDFINAVPPDHQVIGNSDRLLQVFVNLLRNALNAVDANGNIASAGDTANRTANVNERTPHNPSRKPEDTAAESQNRTANFRDIVKGFDATGRDANGRIEVHSRRIAQTPNSAPSVAITVEDNGSGIPPEVLPGIFDAFVTTRLDAHGTGLGLTVTEGIVTQHGGTISASNRPQGGACLEVVLPAA
jgi:signal transduction histidine kinase